MVFAKCPHNAWHTAGPVSAGPLPCPERSLCALGRGLPLLTIPILPCPSQRTKIWPRLPPLASLDISCSLDLTVLNWPAGHRALCQVLPRPVCLCLVPQKVCLLPTFWDSSQDGSPRGACASCAMASGRGLAVRADFGGGRLRWKLAVTVYLSNLG